MILYEKEKTGKDGFNRNIVECKCLTGQEKCYICLRFNRNIVECKLYQSVDECIKTA